MREIEKSGVGEVGIGIGGLIEEKSIAEQKRGKRGEQRVASGVGFVGKRELSGRGGVRGGYS